MSFAQSTITPLLRVRNLKKHFPIIKGLLRRQVGNIKAVDGISFDIAEGETLGLVGESGCGKTTTGRLILRLLELTSGEIKFQMGDKEIDLAALQGEELRLFRKHIQLIFQDPFSSLNPRMTVYDIVAEPLRAQGFKDNIENRVREITRACGLDPEYLQRYPHAFSGGQRQRICIARALILHPKLVVCDEPVSALDVSVQAQIINLLSDLQKEFGLTYLFIAHDLSVVEHISHRVAVMYAGNIVELAPTEELFDQPRHPYTAALMKSLPIPDPTARKRTNRFTLRGEVADPSNLPEGCPFHPRCDFAQPECKVQKPPLRNITGANDSQHLVACHLAEKLKLNISMK